MTPANHARKVLSERCAPPETSWSVEYATAALCAHLWGPKQAGP